MNRAIDVRADDLCANCHREFADHNYVKGSIVKYVCPTPHQESVYGFYHGGDPRNFHPDYELCSPAELNAHRRACEIWDAHGGDMPPEECPSGWILDNQGNAVAHVLRSTYGIGISTYECEQEWKPLEKD